jgi:serine/tyrosine/threonine adenylyltransferase
MLTTPDYQPETAFRDLGPEFADEVRPAEFPQAVPRFLNHRVLAHLGVGPLDEAQATAHFGRLEPLPGAQARPLAVRYHGHQFRTYNPDLGDGRGFLFAQLREAGSGRLCDLSTKGSGQTPYSRSGDGRLTLKGGVREVLATAMLEALGVNTSHSVSLFETGEALERNDEPSPTRAAVLVRRTHSSIRFGGFQRHAFHERADLVARLAEHVIDHYQPDLRGAADPGAALLERVAELSARLVAGWMAAGFVHGVLNTDNMNINGESFDYGPYRFLPSNDPGFVAAYFDHNGLYAFGRQPEAVLWNLRQLAGALLLISPEDGLVAALERFPQLYRDALRVAMLRRLGVAPRTREADQALVSSAFQALAAGGEALGWEPFFHDWFCGTASATRALDGPRGHLYRAPPFETFRQLVEGYEPCRPERLEHPLFARPEPETLLIDEIEAIWAAIAERDDWSPFNAKLAQLDALREAYGFSD